MSTILTSESATSFEFANIDELDPSLSNGYRIVFEREVPIEIRNYNSDEPVRQGTLELIKIKILIAGSDDNPSSIRTELSSEVDLFFHYTHFIDEKGFPKIQETQKLMVNLSDYPSILIKMLNACIKSPHINLAIFSLHNDSEARLDFIQNMEYKFVELMYCVCIRTPEALTQQHITYRYNVMKQRLSLMQNRLQEISNLVKIKNPSLLLQLQKSVPSSGSHSPPAATSYGNSSSSFLLNGNSNSSVLSSSAIQKASYR